LWAEQLASLRAVIIASGEPRAVHATSKIEHVIICTLTGYGTVLYDFFLIAVFFSSFLFSIQPRTTILESVDSQY